MFLRLYSECRMGRCLHTGSMQNTICSCVSFYNLFLLLSVALISSKSSIQAFPRLTCQSRIHRSPHFFPVIWDQVILGRRYGEVGLRSGSSHTVYARHMLWLLHAKCILPSFMWGHAAPRSVTPFLPCLKHVSWTNSPIFTVLFFLFLWNTVAVCGYGSCLLGVSGAEVASCFHRPTDYRWSLNCAVICAVWPDLDTYFKATWKPKARHSWRAPKPRARRLQLQNLLLFYIYVYVR